MPGNRQVNWQVSVTPAAGVATPFTEVTDVQIDHQGESIKGKGDAAYFNTSLKMISASPMITVTSEDEANQLIVGQGGLCEVEAIHIDAETNATGAASDSIGYTLENARVKNHQAGGAHAAYGKLVTIFESRSVDGVTSPLTVTQL